MNPDTKAPFRVITQQEAFLKEIHGDVIELLEEQLECARKGEIEGLALATINKDGSFLTAWTKRNNSAGLLGAVAKLQVRLAQD